MSIFINRKFNDFDEFAATLSAWDATIHQLQKGRTETHLTQFNTGDLLFTIGIFKGITQQQGTPPPFGYTIAVLSDKTSSLNWQKKKVTPNCLMIMPPGSELDVVTKSHAGVYTITFSGETLRSQIELNPELEKLFKQNQLVISSEKAVDRLRTLISKYQFFLDKNPFLISSKGFSAEVNTEVSKKMADCLTKCCDFPESRHRVDKSKVWRRIETFFDNCLEPDIKVMDLYRIARVSERTLLRLFKARFGISPKTYINAVRLNGLHRDLKKTGMGKVKIVESANSWGFWHMGQLAKDYKKMFGELPSQTLRKS
jgi:AraC family ethanolamine operon transcriptional activator